MPLYLFLQLLTAARYGPQLPHGRRELDMPKLLYISLFMLLIYNSTQSALIRLRPITRATIIINLHSTLHAAFKSPVWDADTFRRPFSVG